VGASTESVTRTIERERILATLQKDQLSRRSQYFSPGLKFASAFDGTAITSPTQSSGSTACIKTTFQRLNADLYSADWRGALHGYYDRHALTFLPRSRCIGSAEDDWATAMRVARSDNLHDWLKSAASPMHGRPSHPAAFL